MLWYIVRAAHQCNLQSHKCLIDFALGLVSFERLELEPNLSSNIHGFLIPNGQISFHHSEWVGERMKKAYFFTYSALIPIKGSWHFGNIPNSLMDPFQPIASLLPHSVDTHCKSSGSWGDASWLTRNSHPSSHDLTQVQRGR